jgi:hypothetical protein
VHSRFWIGMSICKNAFDCWAQYALYESFLPLCHDSTIAHTYMWSCGVHGRRIGILLVLYLSLLLSAPRRHHLIDGSKNGGGDAMCIVDTVRLKVTPPDSTNVKIGKNVFFSLVQFSYPNYSFLKGKSYNTWPALNSARLHRAATVIRNRRVSLPWTDVEVVYSLVSQTTISRSYLKKRSLNRGNASNKGNESSLYERR